MRGEAIFRGLSSFYRCKAEIQKKSQGENSKATIQVKKSENEQKKTASILLYVRMLPAELHFHYSQ